MNIVYLQLGSNIGDREQQLESAISEIKEKVGDITNSSKVYESSPWRVDGQSNYLNQKDILDGALIPIMLYWLYVEDIPYLYSI